ncbi:MAG TPA: NAD(P)H-dependent glycerol-3-phosphate dehydrogenase [Marinagarivorans sp.]
MGVTDIPDTVLRVAILGGGSFGTAIANIIATNGHAARLWIRDPARAQECRETRCNRQYLPDYPLHEALAFCSDLAECVEGCDLVVIAIPSKSFREVARRVSGLLKPGTIVVSTTKGIEVDSFTLMSQVLEQELSNVKIGVLSGPNFAAEIIKNQYTASVVASEHTDVLALVPRVFSSGTFRVYTNSDRYGVELAGALKNIYAIATGMAAALGCGHNTMAMLLTRSLAEMSRFANRLGADTMTFLGLAGVGDLILTCTSDLSRNYRAGYAVGQGQSLEQAVADIGQAVEGINTLKTVKQKADELEVYMPLVQALHAVLYRQQSIETIIQQLMTGEATTDVEYDR